MNPTLVKIYHSLRMRRFQIKYLDPCHLPDDEEMDLLGLARLDLITLKALNLEIVEMRR